MAVKILQGDAIEVLRTLPGESVNCCVTSPPYWGLRDYGTAEWAGGDAECDHESEKVIKKEFHQTGARGRGSPTTTIHTSQIMIGDCAKCGATRIDKQLGLERTPEEYVAKMVEVFREVRRVLRDDGTLWLNLGDSYNGSGGWGGDETPSALAGSKQTTNNGSKKKIQSKVQGLKPKDLVGIPWMVAFALRADGWYLRQDIIWHKPNPMPESVTDRCTKSHEYIFLMSKSQRYFYDAAAIAEDAKWERWGNQTENKQHSGTAGHLGNKSLSELPIKDTKNRRSVWTVSTAPFPGAHFATFPPKLIEPCILAGCPTGDTVLDPFGGSGTVGMVAENNGRNSILIELNPKYVEMAKRRTAQCGLF